MNKLNKIFTVSALVLALSACNDDSDNQLNVEGGVSISGETISGQTLTATVLDVNGVNEANISYQWLSNGAEISGATASTYTITDNEIDTTITVAANYTDNDNFDEAVTSEATSVVEAITVNTEGTVAVTGTVESGKELTATITDDNGLSLEGVSYAWLAGTDAIGTDSSTVLLTNTEVGKTITVTVTYIDNDNFSESVTSEATTAVAPIAPAPAEFSGDLAATITANESGATTGTAIVTDINEGEDTFSDLNNITTTYGFFSITTAGAWTYSLDPDNATIAALTSDDDDVIDSITLTSFDGTTTLLTITITGSEVSTNNVAKIFDASDEALGQLRVALEDAGLPADVPTESNGDIAAVESGKMTFSFNAQDIGDSSYFSLYGIRTNLVRAMLEFRIKEDGKLFIRDGGDEIELEQAYVEGEWVDVAITWDTTAATDSVAPTLTLTIDGTPVTSIDGTTITDGSFGSFTSDASTVRYGVTNFKYIVGTNATTVTGSLYIDDLKIYHDVDGATAPLAYEQDFETSEVGEISGTPYHSNTSQAVVETLTVPATPE